MKKNLGYYSEKEMEQFKIKRTEAVLFAFLGGLILGLVFVLFNGV